jgi:hypothetical protein
MALSKIDAANFLTGTIPQGNVANASLNAVTALPAAIPTGKVLQVQSTIMTDAVTLSTSNTFIDITGLSVAITPSSSSNKVLIMYKMSYSNSSGDRFSFVIDRNGTDILKGTETDQNQQATGSFQTANSQNYWVFEAGGSFLDSPSTTSATTYKMQVNAASALTMYINRSGRGTYDGSYASSIIAMEVAA